MSLHADTQGIEVTELVGRDNHMALAEHFGISDPDTEPAPLLAPLLALVPIERERWGAVLSPRAANRVSMEEQRIAADLAYSRRKASGQLRRDDDFRALVAQVQFEDAL